MEYILGKTVLKRELTKKGKECDVNGLWGMHPALPLKLSAMQRLNVQCVYDGKHIRATYIQYYDMGVVTPVTDSVQFNSVNALPYLIILCLSVSLCIFCY